MIFVNPSRKQQNWRIVLGTLDTLCHSWNNITSLSLRVLKYFVNFETTFFFFLLTEHPYCEHGAQVTKCTSVIRTTFPCHKFLFLPCPNYDLVTFKHTIEISSCLSLVLHLDLQQKHIVCGFQLCLVESTSPAPNLPLLSLTASSNSMSWTCEYNKLCFPAPLLGSLLCPQLSALSSSTLTTRTQELEVGAQTDRKYFY